MSILVTGFEPFDGAAENPSWEAVKRLPDTVAGCPIHRLQLPVVYGEAARRMLAEAERIGAAMLLMTGVAGGRTAVTPELVAINYRLARIPDNAGQTFSGERILPGAPDAHMTALPVNAMVAALEAEGLPAKLSLSAGAYVCNDVYFAALEAGRSAVFVHVPPQEALDAAQAARALTICLRTMLQSRAAD